MVLWTRNMDKEVDNVCTYSQVMNHLVAIGQS